MELRRLDKSPGPSPLPSPRLGGERDIGAAASSRIEVRRQRRKSVCGRGEDISFVAIAVLASLDGQPQERAAMDFVFMLTRNDATVENALELIEIARPLGLRHIGFKDVGADASTLQSLVAAIRATGASPWMEVVSTTREAELGSIALARELGVDLLMGGVHVEEGSRILEGSATRYLPFAGKPSGHPTRLSGSAADVEADCRAFAAMGCAGVDILAYRATEAEPIELVAACRRGFSEKGAVVVAGSVNSADRIAAIRAAGADAFTIGTAVIEASYAPGAGPLAAQLKAVQADCRAAG
jgi:hypothetical protein